MLEQLHQISCDYGPTPRLLLERLNPTRTDTDLGEELQTYEAKLEEKIIDLLRNDSTIMFLDRYTHDDSYSIVLLKADPRRMKVDYHLSRTPLRSIISAYIGRKIGSRATERYSKQAQETYNFLLGNALTKPAAGWIFEGRVHACFRRGGGFDIRCLRTGHVSHITLKIGEITFGSIKALSELTRDEKGSIM